MTSFYMGLRVGDKNRRTPHDPRRLADRNPGHAVRGRDGKQYVSIQPANGRVQAKGN